MTLKNRRITLVVTEHDMTSLGSLTLHDRFDGLTHNLNG